MEQFIEFLTNNPILSGAWVVLFIMLVSSVVSGAVSGLQQLSTHDATLLINREDAVVLDIRKNTEYRQGHILGAKHCSEDDVKKGNFSTLEKYKGKPIIVVCAMGMTAKKVAQSLSKLGHNNVSVLKGGMASWQNANLPVSK